MNIRQKIHAVMKQLQGVELVSKPGIRFKMVLHDDVTAALRPLYIEHGIDQEVSVIGAQELPGGTTQLEVKIAWVNIDDPTDRKEVICYGHATPAKQGPDMRRDDLGVGKALSYAVKMAQLKNFALLSGDEDLEQQQAKPQAPAASDTQVEDAMNLLATATTPEQFKVAADRAAQIASGLTAKQSELMAAAWSAAKERVKKPPQEQSAPLPESLGGAPNGGPDLSGQVALFALAYGKVRTKPEFQKVRTEISAVYNQLSPAQKAWLAEKDAAAESLLKAQEAAAQS